MSWLKRLTAVLATHPRLGKYFALVHEDLSATYSRDVQKWLLIAPIIGITSGLLITGITLAILRVTWGTLLPLYIRNPWIMVTGVIAGFLITGLIMQFLTPNPNLHSTEEVIRSYHEHMGDLDFHPFWYKLVAALTTVGTGGSAALEGPSIYGGGAVGSWLWPHLRRLGLNEEDRRLMLISGAAAGMAAVFRAPLTGLIFALEMPYRDDLAHEALLPSLIASVVSYATLVTLVGSEPLFGFVGSTSFSQSDLLWSALLGLLCGLIAMVFAITFRRVRTFVVKAPVSHTLKLLIGGIGTAACGLIFMNWFGTTLIPLGPGYETVREVLAHTHPSRMLVIFAAIKLLATLFSLGFGGVSAMFVPLLLAGGALGSAFGQSVVHAGAVDLFAAVGMASFIAGAYKTPLAAVLFVAETTGGHSFVIPTLIGAAFSYAVSGEASVSGDQRLHEVAKLAELTGITVREVMQPHVIGVQAKTTLLDFLKSAGSVQHHPVYPVFDGERPVGLISIWQLSGVPVERWSETSVGAIAREEVPMVDERVDLREALRLLARERQDRLVLVTGADGAAVGIVTNADVLRALSLHREAEGKRGAPNSPTTGPSAHDGTPASRKASR